MERLMKLENSKISFTEVIKLYREGHCRRERSLMCLKVVLPKNKLPTLAEVQFFISHIYLRSNSNTSHMKDNNTSH